MAPYSSHSHSSDEQSAQPLRVGTFNIRYDNPDDGEQRWERRRERLLEMLRAWGPDVLGLQEALNHQFEQISQGLPGYAAIGIGRNDGRTAGEFCPIFYRINRFRESGSGTFWLSETPDTPGSLGWGARHPRICTWARLEESGSGVGFFVYNVHLDHESQTARDRGVTLLLNRMGGRAPEDPVIVMGDFNAWPDNPAVERLSGADSPAPVSVLAAGQPAETTGGTFHGFTGEAQAMPIDYIFVSPQWQVLDARIMRGDGTRPFLSDHFPVAATLRRG